MSTLIKPPALKKGDTVGVIAPSASVEKSRFVKGIAALEAMGFKTKIALDPTASYGKNDFLFSSDTAEKRARGLSQLFADPLVKAIIVARGAYGTAELTPYLDLKELKNTPKILSGFSDTTALLLVLMHGGQMTSIHGPSIDSAFAKADEDPQAKQSAETLISLMMGKEIDPFRGITTTSIGGSATGEGIVVGGNLTILSALVGTAWEPDYQGKILFIEEVDEKPYRIHRMLLQLKLAGRLKDLRGVFFGYLSRCVHPKGLGPDVTTALKDIFCGAKYPVLMGFPAGHENKNISVPLGVRATISPNKLEFKESAVLV